MPSIRKIPASLKGKNYWRSLDQLADTPEFRNYLHREFPENASEWTGTVSRRNFLTLMSASLALAGFVGCRRPVEKIIPYVVQPEQITPGVAQYYATTMPIGMNAYGVVVESHEGRPTKIEGNPNHPATKGGSNPYLQAAILGLYDPDRAQMPREKGVSKSWDDFVTFWQGLYPELIEKKGKGVAVLSESFASPTLYRLAENFKAQFPEAKWATYEPISDENIYEGIQIATGQAYRPVYDFEKAKVILALDADFMYAESDGIVNSKGFANGRRITDDNHEMNRLYVAESTFTITGGMADHRLRVQARRMGLFTAALAHALNAQGVAVSGLDAVPDQRASFDQKWLQAVAKDLIAHQGQSLVVAGYHQPASVHALVYAINTALGNVGQTVHLYEMTDSYPANRTQFADLVTAMQNGEIDTIIMLGGNPVYNAPVEMRFGSLIRKATHSIHVSPYYDETGKVSEWHINETHFLEAWGDARAANGVPGVIQPLIAPLFDAHSKLEVLNLLTTGQDFRGYDLVRETWEAMIQGLDFAKVWGGVVPNDSFKAWQQVLHDGCLHDETPVVAAEIQSAALASYLQANPFPTDTASATDLEIQFRPGAGVFDGRFANNGWLQEMPEQVSRVTWDNPAFISPNTAEALKVKSQDMVRLTYNGHEITMPVWVMPGQADNSIVLPLGYGREELGRVADGVGFNTYILRTAAAPYFDKGLKITPLNETYEIACIQDHGSMEGRPIVREATLDEYVKHPEFAREMVEHPPLKSLWEERKYDEGYQWGMTIDLSVCTGCNACMIACQSENNVPIVGKEQIQNGREMHWIRVDRYFAGDEADPEMVYQPVNCQHCENAPCEQVCPVVATVHDTEGLNVMVYNRCVGTRYCANNCPYKVRRFNFLEYNPGSSGFLDKDGPEILKMAKNPDVTVRMRGVMEKCSFCTQRISEARIKAKREGREIRDGEVKTACQQGCPTDAIVFGNIIDPDSRVAHKKAHHRNYELLAEYNTKPRTSFLAKIRNPNPELV